MAQCVGLAVQTAETIVAVFRQVIQRVLHGGALAGEDIVGKGRGPIERVGGRQQIIARRVVGVGGDVVARVGTVNS